MPAIVGAVQVINISSSGVFNIGDVYRINPYAATKTYSGAGSFNTGDNIKTASNFSHTQVLDNDLNDQNNLMNI